ncbi:phage holin family protein [Ruminococcus bromii]
MLGEAISILENASRMGVKVPRFFRKIISELQM